MTVTTYAIALAAATMCLWWIRRQLLLVSVVGASMAPHLVDGDRTATTRTGRSTLLGPIPDEDRESEQWVG